MYHSTQNAALLAQTKSHNITCLPTERTFLAKADDEEAVNARKKLGYLKVANIVLRDRRISLKALGILLELLSLPKKAWNYSIGGLASLKTDGRTAVSNELVELEKAGYLERIRLKSSKGCFAELRWKIVDRPVARKEDIEGDAFGQYCQAGYTIIPNSIFFDRRLAYRDVGMLAILSSLPPRWRPSISGLVSMAGSGKTVIKGAIHSLEAKGYLLRERQRDVCGRLDATIIVIDLAAGMRVKQQRETTVENVNNSSFFATPEAENPEAENPEAENEHNIIKINKALRESNDDLAAKGQTVRWAEALSGACPTCEPDDAPLSVENDILINLETTAPSGLQALVSRMPNGKRLLEHVPDSLVEAWNESVRAFEHEWLVYKIFDFSLRENSSHDHARSLSGLECWLRSTEAKDEHGIGFHYVRLYTHGPWKGLKPYDVFSDPDSTILETEEEAYSETIASLGLAQDTELDAQGVYDEAVFLEEWKGASGPVIFVDDETAPRPNDKPFVAVESTTTTSHTVVVSHRTWASRLANYFEATGLVPENAEDVRAYCETLENTSAPTIATVAAASSETMSCTPPARRPVVTENQILESAKYLGIGLDDDDAAADFEAYLARRRRERLKANGSLR